MNSKLPAGGVKMNEDLHHREDRVPTTLLSLPSARQWHFAPDQLLNRNSEGHFAYLRCCGEKWL